ncbi:MAG: cobalamin biosynthesis protein CobD [Lentisphaeria bacterium]|nr:cobalamin biosynthesis protein CobD [Lentisphaeria bacterium]
MNFYGLLSSVLLLDLLLGEPPNAVHPVAWFGAAASRTEKTFRRIFGNGIASGFLAWLVMTLIPACAAFSAVLLACRLHPAAGFAAAALIGYFTVALRSLIGHSRRIRKPLVAGDLTTARRAVSMVVSRDTSALSGSEIVRAGIESLGENLIDAVTSALFWIAAGYCLGGLPGAAAGGVFLRCVNTLDACWGYKDERYLLFGRTAAKTDDWIHFIPARLTLPAIALAAPLAGGSFAECLAVGWKHRKDHPSPNSCYGMAGFAGALRIRLGGPTRYPDGVEDYPCWGHGRAELDCRDLRRAEWLAFFSTVVFALFLAGAYALLRWLLPAGYSVY